MNYLDKLSMENGLHLERNANKSAFISSDRHQAKQAISVLGSVIKQCCGKITRADQTAHEANGKSRHGYALALVSSHDVYFFVFFSSSTFV